MGIALGNMTRMERGETWSQGQNVTPNVGRLLEALDQERIDIASTLGLQVRTIFEHFHLSFHVPVSSISQMNQEMHTAGNGG
ncbi:NAD/NADP octopine/nopaline dehydrogenase family protein, partial [Paraburkholderia sp. SIMBA_055]